MRPVVAHDDPARHPRGQKNEGPSLVTWKVASAGRGEHCILSSIKTPAGALTPAEAISFCTAEADRTTKPIVRLLLCGLNRRFRTWSVTTAKQKRRNTVRARRVFSGSAAARAAKPS